MAVFDLYKEHLADFYREQYIFFKTLLSIM